MWILIQEPKPSERKLDSEHLVEQAQVLHFVNDTINNDCITNNPMCLDQMGSVARSDLHSRETEC